MRAEHEIFATYEPLDERYSLLLEICPDAESYFYIKKRRNIELAIRDTELNGLITDLWAVPIVNIGPQLVTRIADVCAEVAEKHGLTQDEMNEVLNKVLGSFEAKAALK